MSRDPLAEPPEDDGDIAGWTAALGLAGLVDVHVHFLPDRVMTKWLNTWVADWPARLLRWGP